MGYYLIGIGGTGARCMEAFVHMNAAGLLQKKDDVNLLFVDADVACGNLSRTQEAAIAYQKAKRLGFNHTSIFTNAVKDMGVWRPVKDGAATLEKVFSLSVLKNREETKPLGYLFDSMFTTQEKNTDLEKGFRGHPSIGAAVINQKMSKDEDPWRDFFLKVNEDKEAKIFLFASVFGGTGAAGFPNIARLLASDLKKDENGRCTADIGGVLVLPYFQFPAPVGSDAEEMQAKVDDFMLNTKSALEYYSKANLLKDVFHNIYLIGDSDLTEYKNFSLGAASQKNAASYIELYAALAAFTFFNKSVVEEERGNTPMIGRSENPDNAVGWGDIPGVYCKGNIRDRVEHLLRFCFLYKHGVLPDLKKCAEDQKMHKQIGWYKNLVEKVGNIDVYTNKEEMDAFNALGKYIDLLFAWLEDIESNEHRNIDLVNRDIFKEGVFERGVRGVDARQILMPLGQGKNPMYFKEFFQALCNYTKESDGNTVTGAEVLIKAIESISE